MSVLAELIRSLELAFALVLFVALVAMAVDCLRARIWPHEWARIVWRATRRGFYIGRDERGGR